ncbi:MAG: hypothetical protein F6K14_12595 [Symploca sp. SIO2C1]|nr:hypothetical protein [Symploca sp. SIO2C1]
MSEKKGGELGELRELREKRKLIIFGYLARKSHPKFCSPRSVDSLITHYSLLITSKPESIDLFSKPYLVQRGGNHPKREKSLKSSLYKLSSLGAFCLLPPASCLREINSKIHDGKNTPISLI